MSIELSKISLQNQNIIFMYTILTILYILYIIETIYF